MISDAAPMVIASNKVLSPHPSNPFPSLNWTFSILSFAIFFFAISNNFLNLSMVKTVLTNFEITAVDHPTPHPISKILSVSLKFKKEAIYAVQNGWVKVWPHSTERALFS